MKLQHTWRNARRGLPWARVAAATAAVALAGCVVVPQTREVYDPDCRILTRQMTLETAVVGGFQRCQGDGCLAMLTAAGAVTAASAVVSGSIALAGNVVYWFERQGRCNRAPPAAAAAAPLAPSAPASLPAPAPSAPSALSAPK
jgi:hypothetical protein